MAESYYESKGVVLYNGDCFDYFENLPTVDMVLTDLPYGTTSNKWDSVLPLDKLWTNYLSVAKENAAFVFTASQPFTSALVMSQPKLFRHEWVWIKNRGSNFANTVREPMKEHESVLVFSRGKWTYNRQMQERTGGGADRAKYGVEHTSRSENYREFEGRKRHSISELRVPSTWQKYNVEVGLHPTQKPVDLMRYLIRTYTNPGEIVLDNCAGSGTTLLAARLEGRRAIGIEKEREYCDVIVKRLSDNEQSDEG